MSSLLILLVFNCAGQTSAPVMDEAKQLRDHVKANYTKYEYQIPMRDGIKIFTSVYVPKDDSKTYPFMLNRTPYSVAPYGIDNYREKLVPSTYFQKSGLFHYPRISSARNDHSFLA